MGDQQKQSIDLSEIPTETKEEGGAGLPKISGFQRLWGRMDKKTRIYTVVIILASLVTIFLISYLLTMGGAEEVVPGQYSPSIEEDNEEYPPPFP